MLEVPGFSFAGDYRDRQFRLGSDWSRRSGVYIWAREGEPREVIRVGIACGTTGIGGRFALHNRWLRGDFKPDDAREQAVRHFTLRGLGERAEVWAAAQPDRDIAIKLETLVRSYYGSRLSVDLSVRDSWIKQQMEAWRKSGRPMLLS